MVKHYQPSNLFYNPNSNINHDDVQYLDDNCHFRILGSNKIQIGHKNLEKVVTSSDGERLYVGGNGLHLLQFQKPDLQTVGRSVEGFDKDLYGAYNPVEIDEYQQTKFFALRPTNSGHIVIQEPVSNNMVVLHGKTFNQVKVMKGKHKCSFGATYLRNPHFVGEDNTVIWFCGTKSIAVVNFDNMKTYFIDNIVPFFSKSKFGIATRCVSKNQGNAIFLIFVMNNQFYISYYFKGHRCKNMRLQKLLPDYKKVYCMELSLNKSFVFCGGSSSMRESTPESLPDGTPLSRQTSAVISAVRFSNPPSAKAVYSLAHLPLQGATAMTRVSNRDDLIIGGYLNMAIISWDGEKFTPKCIIKGVSKGILRDVWIANNRIFSVSREDEFVGETFFQG